MRIHYDHWTNVSGHDWFWPNFTPEEIASKGDGSIIVNYEALGMLQEVRLILNTPMIILSAYRDPVHNARVGGAPLSRHKEGDAFDISHEGLDINHLISVCNNIGFEGFGYYNTFLHVDLGGKRSWNG